MVKLQTVRELFLAMVLIVFAFSTHANVAIDFETGDFSQGSFSQTTTPEWTVTSTSPGRGMFSAEAPEALGSRETATLNLSVSVTENDSILLFKFRTSSESRYDPLIFSLNGTEQSRWSGELTWDTASYTLAAGDYELSWTYSKDGSVSRGEDRVWIDDIYVVSPSDDTDNDGLSNAEEFEIGTDFLDSDSDDDGLLDGAEVNTHNTNPLQGDTDGDALSDGDEINLHQTNPNNSDSDADGFFDGLEVANNTDPNSATSFPDRSVLIVDFESGDFSQGTFTTDGDAQWTVTTTNTIRGTYSAESPESLEDGQSASLILNVDVLVDGDISYDFRVSSEIRRDGLIFYIDDVEQDSISGEATAVHSFPVTAGQREFKWTYVKSSSNTEGLDRVWVDDISLPGSEFLQRNLFINQLQSTGQCPSTEMIFSVADGFGNPISDLTIDDITLTIAGQDVAVDSLELASSNTGSVVNAAITMDYSGSMSSSDIRNMEAAASVFVNQLSDNDRAEIIKFGSSVVTVQEFTSDKTLLLDAIDAPSPTSGETAFFDSVYQAITSTSAQVGRNAVIAMTDGADNNSLRSFDETIEYAVALGIPVFTIGLGNANETVLQNMATSTGGQYFYAPDSDQLEEVYQSISSVLENQYRMVFTDPGLENIEHELVMSISSGAASGQITRTYTGCRDFSSQINQVVELQCPVLQAVVTVADQYGNPFDGLTQNNFVLSVDDTDIPILNVIQVEDSQTNSGISSALVMDYSGSMSNSDISAMEQAATSLVQSIADVDEAMIIKFDDEIDVMQTYTSDKDLLAQAITNPSSVADGGGTAVYDAIYVALTETSSQLGRKAIIALTDGQDNNSGRSLNEVIDYANELGIPVFTIGLGDADATVLTSIAQQTGAQYYYAPSANELATIYASLADVLQSQYLIEFEDIYMDNMQHVAQIDVVVSNQTIQSSSRTFNSCAAPTFALIDFETGDFSQANFSVSGDAQWTVTNTLPSGGTYSAEAPESLENSQQASLILTMNTYGGEFSFDFATSTESSYDYLNFYIDGERAERWSGSNNFTTASFQIAAGEHEFRWEYDKDGSASINEDRVWIDNIRVPIESEEPESTPVAFDFDGDGMADIAVRRPQNYIQYILNSDDLEIQRVSFGRNVNDIPITGDFDGDGIYDVAVRRPATKFWYILNSSNSEIQRIVFGQREEDIPVPADYDGDGITDVAVRRPSTQFWYIKNSSGVDHISNNADGITRLRFGLNADDIPVPADYDGDGKADLAVRRASTRFWYVLNSSGVDHISGFSDGITRKQFGNQSTDIPVPADYDGDGKTDLAVRRPASATWYVLNSSGTDPLTGNSDGITRRQFGSQSADIPVPADYDGDGKADLAVRRASTQFWYINNSSGSNFNSTRGDGIQRHRFGLNANDIPLAATVTTRMAMLSANTGDKGTTEHSSELDTGTQSDLAH